MPIRCRWPPENWCGIAGSGICSGSVRPSQRADSTFRSRRLVQPPRAKIFIGSAMISPDGHSRIERCVGVLKYHLQCAGGTAATPRVSPLIRWPFRETNAPPEARHETEDARSDGGFAEAALADEAERFPGGDAERNAADRVDPLPRPGEPTPTPRKALAELSHM